ncbi:MAG: hypothetical protein GW906_11895 [Epsilonproteobacteria bacterium]|nr:hypothetical protein [Campylobacterota bacterium]OIO15897.1 MAG: hypothetical protein AUJ81_06080 [Helicobacteraceae bacterium CG1_02_36_14]PIP11500.1 MAG: hypothetical protein COX50_00345 [Sulfurimonas sp. CG23_combo_of_CG06-09_8_20_14_all_36_33]PIS24770.1 MAG: hypothetical protein COT46_08275 [Sulfurimonas sp. CG08_land_8_20_14_0_20_36_33]PIU35945.1 MAG: hypothetical protein COT05_01320 [Sulfurimonas sp. CG07_land_8_20_14_0_80_36_56]PIV04552.1 MAG: hypothetical protein COS56_04515 [Sulfur
MNMIKLLFLLTIFVNLSFAKEPYTDAKTLEAIAAKYKMFAKKRFFFLQQSLDSVTTEDDLAKLNAVNEFYNEVKYSSDIKTYGQKDYWATPYEFLGKDMGDCEDYVIAKYFALRYLGMPAEKLFFTYVKSTKFKETHMVLTYFKTPRSEPLILDNNNRRIFPASKRKDLIPIYNFNGETLKKSKQEKSHKKWDELKLNMQRKKI